MFKNKFRESAGVNAGSMADVAFLLLIFFLVVTTIEIDKAITVKLPPWCEGGPDCEGQVDKNRVLSIKINSVDELLVRGELIDIEQLKERSKEFIMNPLKKSNYPASPDKAIISLGNDRATSYKMYLSVYNELKATYNELWDESANIMFGTNYEDLSVKEKSEIRNLIPLVISEAEPTDFAAF